MSLAEELKSIVGSVFEADAEHASTETPDFPLMPLGTPCDMGRDENGVPLIDPRLFGSREFQRNPYPYYHIMQDHYPVFHDRLNNCYFVTRYADISEAYFDGLGVPCYVFCKHEDDGSPWIWADEILGALS